MKHKPQLSDVMTREPETVHLGQPLSDAYALLQRREYHHVPVVNGDKPVGMISSTDILKLVYDVENNDERMLRTMLDHQFTLEETMSTDLVTVRNGESVRTVANHLSTGDNHSVLVLNDDGGLEGIVTSSDLIRNLAELL
ncbi:MAG: CBS domain-containing protein [Acidimicrobiales bacterium]